MKTSLPTPLYRVDSRTDVYPPAEDTFLLLDTLELEAELIVQTVKPKIAVEIGCGSGIVSTFIAKMPEIQRSLFAIFCTDLNRDALECTKLTADLNSASMFVNTINCNLIDALRLPNAVDLLVFNPPYVPTDEAASSVGELSYAGGPHGRNAVDSLLPQIPSILSKPNGVFYLIALHANDVNLLCNVLEKEDIQGTVCAKRRCGIELLYVLKYTWKTKTLIQMADAIRGFWQNIVTTKRAYLNPHEHFGRANITRAALLTYVGIYLAFKWNKTRKAKHVELQKIREKENILNDALARAAV
ncbi:MTS domain-containing protein [Aphelenchoides besseyi]|nr:MTS domain-containing protein [Aphelenchoides besseyi]KAI6194008.1 MTS domain-containing protein [Aphelenchoides besseyi]